MNILAIIAVCFFAGMGAGLGTGFAGMSAAAVITPMLVTFLKMEPYEAVGIALVAVMVGYALALVRAYRSLKGMNGDISGYCISLSELAGLCAMAIL